jgi:hypothetical protein
MKIFLSNIPSFYIFQISKKKKKSYHTSTQNFQLSIVSPDTPTGFIHPLACHSSSSTTSRKVWFSPMLYVYLNVFFFKTISSISLNILESENHSFICLWGEKKLKSKNCWSQPFQKSLKSCHFYERIGKEPGDL